MEKTEQTKAQTPRPDPAKAAFRLIVYFKDGNKRTFYSYHTAWNAEEKKVLVNDKIAINKLIRLLQFKFKNKFITGLIYHNTGKQIYKYCFDRMIQEATYNFQYINGEIRIKL